MDKKALLIGAVVGFVIGIVLTVLLYYSFMTGLSQVAHIENMNMTIQMNETVITDAINSSIQQKTGE